MNAQKGVAKSQCKLAKQLEECNNYDEAVYQGYTGARCVLVDYYSIGASVAKDLIEAMK